MTAKRLNGVLRAAFVACAAACLAIALCLVPSARAQDGVTRTIGGINYTLPADWDGGSIAGDEAVELLGSDDVCQVDVYGKEDGLFLAAAFESEEAAELTAEDLDSLTTYALGDGVVSGLSIMSYLGVDIYTGTEQGCPTLTVYTEQVELNHVTYALTGKLFLVNNAQFKGGVFIVLLMPASGTLTEDFIDSFPVLDEPQDIVMADASMTIPAGCTLVEGSLFGLDFALAVDQDGPAGMLAFNLPFITYDGSIDAQSLQDAIDEVMGEFGDEVDQLRGDQFWVGALDFLGFPSMVIEVTLDADELQLEEGDPVYVGAMGTLMNTGVLVLTFVEPLDYGLCEYVVSSMELVAADGPVASGAVGEDANGGDLVPKADKGFVVTVL